MKQLIFDTIVEPIIDKVVEPIIEHTIIVNDNTWYKLGKHLLYCGNNIDEKFINEIKKHQIAFIFADPPYNANVAEWDENFKWNQDYLIDFNCPIAITPGISSIHEFMNITKMTYKWSIACWITNGGARSAIGFGNWIYVAIFSKESIYKGVQDIIKINLDPKDSNITQHKGRKPFGLIKKLIEIFAHGNDDIIVDPFLGSGTTLLAIEDMNHIIECFDGEYYNRICIGAEISKKYCEEIINRWEKLTGLKHERYY